MSLRDKLGATGAEQPSLGHLLVVDDNPQVADAVRALVPHYAVTASCSGSDAIEQLGERTFDAVILDIKMPGMTGLQVIRIVQDMYPQLPVIMHTGYPGEFPEQDIIKGFEPFGYVVKGDIEKLVTEVERAQEASRTHSRSVREGLLPVFEQALTCPHSVFLGIDAGGQPLAMVASEVPQSRDEIRALLQQSNEGLREDQDQNVYAFCRQSPLFVHLASDGAGVVCPCLHLQGETYHVETFKIKSKVCTYYRSKLPREAILRAIKR